MSDSTISKDAIVVERIIDAPVELVWRLWTQPEHFKNWYGPQGFRVFVAEMDVRVGGRHLFCMETDTPDGTMKMWLVGEYTEIVPNKRLVYTDSPSDENGRLVPLPADGTAEAQPLITEVTVLLEDVGGRTRMTVTHAGVPSDAGGASEGWEQAFTKLASYVKTITTA
ncbi:MAG: SRPBCC domain-containing protein [Anaerolineae bacterium]|nr:SRPBCC domain-containing protein [Anaerolineae bacterium]